MSIKDEIAKKRKARTVILVNKNNSLEEIENSLKEQNISLLDNKILNLKLNYIDNELFDDKICLTFNISKDALAEYYIEHLSFFENDIENIINSITVLSKTAYQKLFKSDYFLSLIEHLTFEQKMYYYLTLSLKSYPELTEEVIQKVIPIDNLEIDFIKKEQIKK